MGEVSAVCEAPNPLVSAQGFMHQINKKNEKKPILLFKASSLLSRPIRYIFKVCHLGTANATQFGSGYFKHSMSLIKSYSKA